jgi:hypothetical protein
MMKLSAAGNRLIALGGLMPEAEASPPTERSSQAILVDTDVRPV